MGVRENLEENHPLEVVDPCFVGGHLCPGCDHPTGYG